MMRLLQRLFGRPDRGAAPLLYQAVVARARAPHWYAQGAVPDTLDGRFDMVAAILALVLIRLERDPAGVAQGAMLTEVFIEDMDGQLREIGIGDLVVGKHVGRMMAMLGGRIGAFREGLAARDLKAALVRNLYRGAEPAPGALAHVEAAMFALAESLDGASLDSLIAGGLPQ